MTTRRPVAALAAATCLASLGAGTALAHTDVESSTPRDGAVLARTPATATVTFGEPMQRVSRITVSRNGQGNLVKSARLSPRDASVATVTLKRPGPKKQPGTYRLRWEVVGADGHALTGTITYRVRPR